MAVFILRSQIIPPFGDAPMFPLLVDIKRVIPLTVFTRLMPRINAFRLIFLRAVITKIIMMVSRPAKQVPVKNVHVDDNPRRKTEPYMCIYLWGVIYR